MNKAWGIPHWSRRRAPVTAPQTPDVHDGVAQFLAGQMLERPGEDRTSVPDWVWVSVLAHGSEERLVTCAAEGGVPSTSSTRCVWDRTLSYLCQVLLDHAARTGEPLSLLQHDIVVPIELGLGARPLAPPTLVRLVLSGLDERARPAPTQPVPTSEGSA